MTFSLPQAAKSPEPLAWLIAASAEWALGTVRPEAHQGTVSSRNTYAHILYIFRDAHIYQTYVSAYTPKKSYICISSLSLPSLSCFGRQLHMQVNMVYIKHIL